jgi:hypothetical protein
VYACAAYIIHSQKGIKQLIIGPIPFFSPSKTVSSYKVVGDEDLALRSWMLIIT